MALGKNLKKQQLIKETKSAKKATKKKVLKKTLIPAKDQADSKKKSATAKKKTVASPKKSAPSPKKKTTTAKKQPVAAKKKPIAVSSETQIAPKLKELINYISEKQQGYRADTRKRQKEELAQLPDTLQIVVFEIGNEEFALDISQVKEVVLTVDLSAAPNSPNHVKGMASIRGKTYLAMDLNLKFQNQETTDPKFLLVINHEEIALSLLLESLPSTLKCESQNISPDLSMLDQAAKNATFIKGIIQIEDRIIFYMDVKELVVSDNSMVVPDELINS
mgnify:CR=1 FL=1